MSILTSIETARKAGIKDDAILNQIMAQNPERVNSFETAINRGAKASDIVNEIIKQNQGKEAINRSGLDRMIEQKNIAKEEPVEQVKEKKSFLRKAGEFFTGSTQKFAETLGTAASVIDPKTKKLREETLASAQSQADNYLQMAKNETDKEKKDKLLKAAAYLADTEGIDIYNNPEYQKTAKQVYGEAIGVAAETLGWGKVGNIAKTVKASTVAQTAIKAAKTGAVLGATTSTGSAMAENKSTADILKSAGTGAVTGAVIGGATGALAGKIGGKISKKSATKLASKRVSGKEKVLAYKTGRAKEATLLKSEKIIPTQKEKELGKLAQEIGLKGNTKKDITKINKAIEQEAKSLKKTLKESGSIYNKNNVKGVLNKMKKDKTIDLIEPEVKVYEKMIKKFNKMVDSKKNKGIDGLLELRQEFDKWAKSNSPTIFKNKRGGAYRAVSSVRDAVNTYIDKNVKGTASSLAKQRDLYTILDNISEKAAKGSTKLKPSKIKVATKKLFPWAGGAAGLEILRRTISGNSNKSNTYSDFGQEE